MGTPGYENGFALTLMPQRLEEPLRRKKPTIYFVNSMSDLFHEKVPDDYIERIVDVMARTPHHSYQVLTKRAARMARFFKSRAVPDNVWLRVSVEN
jgi:protein gp37